MGDPFLALGDALTVGSAGIYYFNIGGTTFNTHVDINGYVLVAIDFGDGSGNLPQGTALNLLTRGILNPATLSSLGTAIEVRISTDLGQDVVSSDPGMINRVITNRTLHGGISDNVLNNSWAGVDANLFTGDAICTTGGGISLHQNIFHPCGNIFTFHWIPSTGNQTEQWDTGEVPSGISFRLWVRDHSAVLPIELLEFKATPIKEERKVLLQWITASEINNDYFDVERSRDGISWDLLTTMDGAGNSSAMIDYQIYDHTPYHGTSFYRLKQINFDGSNSYSDIRSVNLGGMNILSVYPNPSSSTSTILINSAVGGTAKIHVYDEVGKEIYSFNLEISAGVHEYLLDFSELSSGMYRLNIHLNNGQFLDQIQIQLK